MLLAELFLVGLVFTPGLRSARGSDRRRPRSSAATPRLGSAPAKRSRQCDEVPRGASPDGPPRREGGDREDRDGIGNDRIGTRRTGRGAAARKNSRRTRLRGIPALAARDGKMGFAGGSGSGSWTAWRQPSPTDGEGKPGRIVACTPG